MKKIITVLTASLLLASCTNENATKSNQLAQNEENKKVTIDVNKPQANNTSEEEKSRPAEENQAASGEDIEVDTEDENQEDELDQESDDSKEAEDPKDKEAEQTPEEKSSAANDDLFFITGNMVTIDENGDLIGENGEDHPANSLYNYIYVPYSSNMYVRTNTEDLTNQLVRLQGNKFTTIYDFNPNEDFYPLGLVDKKVYGYHSYRNIIGEADQDVPTEESSLAVLDLNDGKIYNYEKTKGLSTGTMAVSNKELQFSSAQVGMEGMYKYDLYKLDLSKGYNQEPELIEKDFDLQYLFGQKDFVDGNPQYNIRRADNENIYVDDAKYPFLWAEQGDQSFVGNNIIYTSYPVEEYGVDMPFVTHIKIIDLNSGEEVLNQNVRGYKLKDGKFFYITEDNEIKSIELDL